MKVLLRGLCFVGALVFALPGGGAYGQGMVGDVLSGKIINPEVGVFAWYDVTDAVTEKTFFLRQAIVGEEEVKRKKGYWVETEIIPQVGFPAVYKMLLTGPASEAKNVHAVIYREGDGPTQSIPVNEDAGASGKKKKAKRESLGEESIETPQGPVKAEHVVLTEDGVRTDLWLNNDIRPMGIVRMKSAQGELVLRRFGKGGQDGESALPSVAAAPGGGAAESTWHVRKEDGPRTNFKGKAAE